MDYDRLGAPTQAMFRIQKSTRVECEIRRIGSEEIANAIADIDSEKLTRDEKIHQVRKRCKKLRGLLRLVRPRFHDTYRSEDKRYRGLARTLAEFRDASTLVSCYDQVTTHFEHQVNVSAFGSIREQLTKRRSEYDDADIDQRLAEAREIFEVGKQDVSGWKISKNGFKVVVGGLSQTRQRAVDRLGDVLDKPDTEALHEFRKRIKYHGYHMRLLRDVCPLVTKPAISCLKELGELLGDDHDLAVFQDVLSDLPNEPDWDRDAVKITDLICQRRLELQASALHLGQFLFGESTESFAERMGVYWKLWR